MMGWVMVYFLLLSFMLGGFPLALGSGTTMSVDASSQADAEELWEKAIAAKGGRERLHAIRSVLITKDFKYWVTPFKRARNLHVTLVVLPDKSWSWDDYRPGKLGLRVKMINPERNYNWLTYPNDPKSPRRLTHTIEPNLPFFHLREMIESPWLQIVPFKATSQRIKSKTFHVVYVRAGAWVAKYYLDTKTFLLARIEFVTLSDMEKTWGTYQFFDYVEVDGIQVPSKYRVGDSAKIPRVYQFNVEYDPGIFERPPTVEAGPDAWRVKR